MSRFPRSGPPEPPPTPTDGPGWDRFAGAWRRRVDEPPRLGPEAAAARVAARLAERDVRSHRSRSGPWRLELWQPALAGVAALLAVATLWLSPSPEAPLLRAGDVSIGSGPESGELVLWLDDETSLHFTLEPSAAVADDIATSTEGDFP